MELRYNINGNTIQEPIGFDGFKSRIFRHAEHGISIETSVDELEFYDDAFNIIVNAGIEDVLIFTAEIIPDGYTFPEILYTGQIDLTTKVQKQGDYCSVSCKLSETGAKALFNNRTETKVNVNAFIDIDGNVLTNPYNFRKKLTIPAKPINKISKVQLTSDSDIFTDAAIKNTHGLSCSIPFGGIIYGENKDIFETFIPSSNTFNSKLFQNNSGETRTYNIKATIKFAIKTSIANLFNSYLRVVID